MYMNDYQHKAHEYAAYRDDMYPWFALAEEAGEVMGKLAKNCRGDYDNIPTPEYKEMIAKELGDVLWCLQECCGQLDMSLDEVATMNLRKLADRKERNKIRGDGDER